MRPHTPGALSFPFAIGVRGHSPSADPPPREDDFLPLRLTAGCRTLNAAIVVRIHEGERRCSSAEERRSHTAKVGCSNQPTGTNPCGSSVARTPECESGGRRFDSVPRDQISDGRCRRRTDQHRPSVLCHPSFEGGVAQRKSGGLQNRVSAGSIPASPANFLDVRGIFPRAGARLAGK